MPIEEMPIGPVTPSRGPQGAAVILAALEVTDALGESLANPTLVALAKLLVSAVICYLLVVEASR